MFKVSEDLQKKLVAYGGESLLQVFEALLKKVVDVQYPSGFVLTDVAGIPEDQLLALWETNLFHPRLNGRLVLWRDPGYDGPLVKIRKHHWNEPFIDDESECPTAGNVEHSDSDSERKILALQ